MPIDYIYLKKIYASLKKMKMCTHIYNVSITSYIYFN